jgi:hypothetical protein
MKKYFYSNGQKKDGPVTLEELKKHNIQPETLIWHEELDDWTKAENVDELKDIFVSPLPTADTQNKKNDKKKKKKKTIKNRLQNTLNFIYSLDNHEIIIVCMVFSVIIFLILGYGFIEEQYFTPKGIRRTDYDYGYDIFTRFNYLIGVSGSLISFGVSYLYLNSKKKKHNI